MSSRNLRSLLVLGTNLILVFPAFAGHHHGPLRGIYLGTAYRDLAQGNVAGAERALEMAGYGGASGHIVAAHQDLANGNYLGAINQLRAADIVRNGISPGPGVGPGMFPGAFPGGFPGAYSGMGGYGAGFSGGGRYMAVTSSPFDNMLMGRRFTGFGSYGWFGSTYY